ncbi:MAG: 2-hydroxyacid dehydrogenase [Rhizobiales bacterium]|mgnify:CR=1 FL=1|nr:2-hydroxyacid dehydrogenase [Hyphomicrobiales bacterium]
MVRMKALLHLNLGPASEAIFAKATFPDIVPVGESDWDRFYQELADTEVLLHSLVPVTKEIISRAPHLRLIQKIGIGVNTIDLNAAREAGIAVANMPGTNTQAVAEHALGLMLAVLRKVGDLDRALRTQDWVPSTAAKEGIGEISGSTIGLIGYGAVGQRLAPVLAALGAKVQVWSRSMQGDGHAEAIALDKLLSTSNIISLHVPFTPQTDKFIGREAFAAMRPDTILINTARGELVDEAALVEALQQKRIAGAGLDVFHNEPRPALAALRASPNVILTPHIAWLTPQTLARSFDVITENCRRLGAGEPLLHRVV